MERTELINLQEKISVISGLTNQKWGLRGRARPYWMSPELGKRLRQRAIANYYREAQDLGISSDADMVLKTEPMHKVA